MPDQHCKTDMGIGATKEFSLRVSVAALARVCFEHPEDGELMLALERRVTLYKTETGHRVQVKSQPFGGALRIHDLKPLQDRIGGFHFDSEYSRAEQDFRLLIRPSDWEAAQRFCLQHFKDTGDLVLESDPWRELEEEFAEVLGIRLRPDQLSCRLVETVIEDAASPTENIHAQEALTARIYRIFEARVFDPSLASMLLGNGENYFGLELRNLMTEHIHKQPGERFNTVLALPCQKLTSFYSGISPALRNAPVSFQDHLLDETVAAVLGIDVPKYRRV